MSYYYDYVVIQGFTTIFTVFKKVLILTTGWHINDNRGLTVSHVIAIGRAVIYTLDNFATCDQPQAKAAKVNRYILGK